jgi:hypothetical protein
MSARKGLTFSADAAIVLALAETAVPFAASAEDEAERWVRVLRLHGQVGSALQALGVGEAPLESPAQSPVARARRRSASEDVVGAVARRAARLAVARQSETIATVDLLFAVFDVYRGAFDRALYIRGTTREELIEHLRSPAHQPR